MDYGKYKNARDASWRCLLDYNINSLPVAVSGIIRKSKDIKLVKNSQVDVLKDGCSGITLNINGTFNIIYRDTEDSRRCRFTIAHELGHIFLGHILVSESEYMTFSDRDYTENEANVFARDLLAPACILHELGITAATDIAKFCNISMEAAKYRSERMKELEKRNAWYLHPLEREVKNQFNEFIKINSTK